MSPSTTLIDLERCEACHARFLPGDGPCPKCGSTDCVPYTASAVGRVLVSTELMYPAAGWTSPHPLAVVELSDAVRVLAVVEGAPPAPGVLVEVERDGDIYRARPEPTVG